MSNEIEIPLNPKYQHLFNPTKPFHAVNVFRYPSEPGQNHVQALIAVVEQATRDQPSNLTAFTLTEAQLRETKGRNERNRAAIWSLETTFKRAKEYPDAVPVLKRPSGRLPEVSSPSLNFD